MGRKGLARLIDAVVGLVTVSVLYPVNAKRLYSSAGKGAAIPVQVRVDMPALSGTLYDRQIYRRLQASRGYTLSARIFNKTNRDEIVALTGEVLAKTHCKGGSITADMAGGDFARSFGKRAKAPGGGFYAPGWVVSYTYRRWRAK
jgi:hypothetical protein